MSVEVEPLAFTVSAGVGGWVTVKRATGGAAAWTVMLCVAGAEALPPVSTAISVTV